VARSYCQKVQPLQVRYLRAAAPARDGEVQTLPLYRMVGGPEGTPGRSLTVHLCRP
jgi:hypothetical protein